MKKLLLMAASVCAIFFGPSSAGAAVVLTFDTDTQGFTTQAGNAANGGIAWSANHGGSVAVTANIVGWTNPLGMLSLTATPAWATEFQAALANGGTLSFDYIVDRADFAGMTNGSIGWVELVGTANSDSGAGGGWDQNVIGGVNGYYGTIPEGITVRTVTMDIVASPPVNDTKLNFGVNSGWNEFLIGINSGDPANSPYTSATIYIDNVTLTAVPEPASMVMLGGAAVAGLWRRRSLRRRS